MDAGPRARRRSAGPAAARHDRIACRGSFRRLEASLAHQEFSRSPPQHLRAPAGRVVRPCCPWTAWRAPIRSASAHARPLAGKSPAASGGAASPAPALPQPGGPRQPAAAGALPWRGRQPPARPTSVPGSRAGRSLWPLPGAALQTPLMRPSH